jgi:uncharacterized membrane protein SpoIIM required for sporulation
VSQEPVLSEAAPISEAHLSDLAWADADEIANLPADTRRFRAAREPEWRRLERIVTAAEKGSLKRLSDEDLIALPVLYRGALSSLSVARETSLDLELINYLEGLCARAYFYVYGVRTTPLRRLGGFFARDWPAAVKDLWRETLASLLLTLIGAAAGYLLVANDPSWFGSLVPESLASGRDFSATPEHLRSTLYDQGDGMLSLFATFLFTHNSQVAILAFALGFAFGVPSAMLLVHNGTVLGAFMALFASHGMADELGGWLIIHGSTEIFAIVLAGAAGLKIGWAVVFPGEETRLEAATRAGRTAAIVMGGVLVMLFAAGLLEGIGRQVVTSQAIRYGVGLTLLLLWMLYFYAGRRREAA